MSASLQTKNLTKHFDGVFAVKNLSVEFRPGEITGLIGPNGSGKSTLINLLTGLVPFAAGAIHLGGEKLSRLQPYEAVDYRLTRTFQEVRLFEQLPVIDNLLVVLTERPVWSALFERHSSYHLNRAEELLKQVDLWEKRHTLAINLSYGQRKLLELARAQASAADIYLFDEPFAGLFPRMVEMAVGVLKGLRAAGKTVVLVEHNMNLIRELSDRVVVMDSGELLAEGKPDEVLAKPEVIEAYLGE